jgi:squalene-hopene/tetraprenyl-beta-curcumene cyclase
MIFTPVVLSMFLALGQPGPAAPPTPSAAAVAVPDAGVIAAASAERAVAFLRSSQDKATGGWSVPKKPGQPHLPAITALVINGLLMQPGITAEDPAVARGIDYILSHQKPDGGIYDSILPSYNTAISISALARVDSDRARQAVAKGVAFLKNSQWGTATPAGVGGPGGAEAPQSVPETHPFFGGWGYGNRGRPDISNTAFALQALHDAEIPPDDPAFQRAVIFLQRMQMLEKDPAGKVVNEMPYAKGSRQGGFIYATAEDAKSVGAGQSFAGMIEETLDDGSKVSKLRAYGSATYLGFKSYLYAGLKMDDPRVRAVVEFLGKHYAVSQNPGLGTDGQYYYYVMMARALDASGLRTIETTDVAGRVVSRNWRTDLALQLAALQNPDGSFMSLDDRWMENNPDLITAYALLALQHTRR